MAADGPPGVVIDYVPASSKNYIGSPTLAILPNGDYVAAHDFFGPGARRNRTAVFASVDRGKTWTKRAEIDGQFWSSLFVHRGALYIFGASKEHGFCIIRRSTDGGATWTMPADKKSGLLFADAKYHSAPVPVVLHRGRVWRAMEDCMGPGKWGSHFRAFVMSAAEDADLLDADQWTASDRLGRDPAWLGGKFGGWLEGNVVVAPDGQLVNVLRADYRTDLEKAAIIRYSIDDGGQAKSTFDSRAGIVDFPGGCKKFTIRRDAKSGRYWSLVNAVAEPHKGTARPDRVRNALYLSSSADLVKWELGPLLLYHPDPGHHAFQYVDWHFDGDDIIAVSRTAFDDSAGGAHNQHDANYMTFHRIRSFRDRAAVKAN